MAHFLAAKYGWPCLLRADKLLNYLISGRMEQWMGIKLTGAVKMSRVGPGLPVQAPSKYSYQSDSFI